MIDEAPPIQTDPFDRPDPAWVMQLRDTPTGFLVDAMGGSGALDFRMAPAVVEQYAFCGVALTCHTGPADNLALIHALEAVQPGDVIVACTDGYTGCAVTGDLVLGMARNRGAVGFVTDGCVRDRVGLRKVGLPAWAMGVTPNSPHRSGPGTVGRPVTLGRVPVCSGDIVVADLDGVVIVPRAQVPQVLARLPAICEAEAKADESVRNGAIRPGFLR